MKPVTRSLTFALFCGTISCAVAATSIVACSSSTTPGSSSSGGTDVDASETPDSGVVESDSGSSGGNDSSTTKDAGGYPHRFGASDVGGTCEFNRDCKEGLRCECTKGECACKTGVRGEGFVSAPCTTNEECGSAVCFDDRLCTDECTSNTQCKGELPNCKGIIGFSANLCLP